MITPHRYPGVSGAKQPYAEFVTGLGPTQFLGDDESGQYPIYGMERGNQNNPTVLIIGGSHGHSEWGSVRVPPRILQLMELPENNWLLNNFHFYAIPCINPWGYENGGSLNSNAVNLARNCDYMWELGDPGQRGPAPWSEAETVIMRDVILNLKPVVVIDCHSWGGYEKSALGPIHHPQLWAHPRVIAQRSGQAVRDPEFTWYQSAFAGFYNIATVYNWARHETTSSVGLPPFTFLLEAGTLLSIEEQNRQGVMALMQVLNDFGRHFLRGSKRQWLAPPLGTGLTT